jgi:hypothetical protein
VGAPSGARGRPRHVCQDDGVSVPSGRSASVFISHSADEDIGPLVAVLRDLGYLVETPASVAGWQPVHAAIVEKIQNSDLLVAVLDSPAPNVSFEVGIAVGAGTPVLLLSGNRRPAQDLAGLPRIEPGASPEAFADALARTIRGRELSHQAAESIRHAPALPREMATRFLASAANATDGASVEGLVASLFEQVGAQVLRTSATERRTIAPPDLVIWHDELAAGFGLPLPVEVLVRTLEPRAILGRLRRTRDHAGAPSLLAIDVLNNPPLVEVDDDGKVLVIAPLQMVIAALADLPVGEALAMIRAQAALVNAAS